MENVLINFVADPSGLQPGIDGLEQMNVVDKELADQVKKTGQAIDDRNKKIKDSTKQSGSELEKLVGYFKNLDKSIVGGAFTKTLKDLDKAVTGVSDHYKALSTAIDIAKKKQADFKPNSPEWKELDQQISNATEILSQFQQQQDKTTQKTTTLKTQLRALKEEIATRLGNGESQADIQDLLDKAGELDDRLKDVNTVVSNIGSDTRNVEGLIEIAGAGVGAFSALQGTLQLVGDQSDDTQRAMQRLFGVMSFLQGVQQVQKAIEEQSAAIQFIRLQQQKIAILQTKLQTAAESENIVVKYASIAASKALNAVMAASPAGILLTIIGAIAGALLYFTSNTETAADRQIKLNEALKDEIDYLKTIDQLLSRPQEDRIKQLQNELEMLRSKRVSQNEILKKEKELADAQAVRANASKGFYAQEIKDIDTNSQKLESLKDKLKGLQNEMRVDGDRGFISRKLFGTRSKDDIQKDIDAVKGQIENTQSLIDAGIKSRDDADKANADQQAKANEIQKKIFEDNLKSYVAYSQARVTEAKRGSKEELNARIAEIRAEQKAILANPDITPGEKEKAIAESNRKISDLTQDFNISEIQKQKDYIDAQVAITREGSREQLAAKLASLDREQEIEEAQARKQIEDANKLNAALAKIKDETEQKREALKRTYGKGFVDEDVTTQIAAINSQISQLQIQNADATSTKLLKLKEDLIDKETAIEVAAVQFSTDTEEDKRIRIKAIYDKALADKKELEKAKARAELDEGQSITDSIYDREIAKAQLVLDNERSTYKERKKATDDYFDNIDKKIKSQQSTNDMMFALQLESYAQYLKTKNDLATQADQNDLAREKAHQARMEAIRDFAAQTAVNLNNVVFNIAKKQYDYEEQRVKDLFDQKQISETEYNNQLKKIRREQSNAEKEQAIFTMLVNQGPTLMKAFQQGGFPAIAAATGLFFSLLGALQGEKVPAYKDGDILIGGPGTETSDSIVARLSKNESVIKASMSKKHEGALRAINEDRYHQYLVQHEIPKLYSSLSLPELPDYVQNISYQPERIDYDKLGEVIAQKLAENPQSHLSFDENGFMLSVKQGNDTIQYKNKKLNA